MPITQHATRVHNNGLFGMAQNKFKMFSPQKISI